MNKTACLLLLTFCFACCSKSNEVTPVTGSINGVPAITLYGGSKKLNDYVLLGKEATKKQMSYLGTTYDYTNIDSLHDIRIEISSTVVMRGRLDTTGTIIKMTIDTLTHAGLFGSTEYTSR
jgi:hypothetical protein